MWHELFSMHTKEVICQKCKEVHQISSVTCTEKMLSEPQNYEIESVQRYFTKRLSGLSKLSYHDRLVSLKIEILERICLVCNLVFYYKMLHRLLSLIHI